MSVRPYMLPMKDADVRYIPQAFSSSEADADMQTLITALPWQQDDIKMFGRTVRIPRLQVWCGDKGTAYRYSGKTLQPHPWHPILRKLRERCESICGSPLNAVLGNYYRDGNDSMGWHADNEPELVAGSPIVSVSFGVERDFDFKHVDDSREKPCRYRLSLEHGSVLIMHGDTQKYWQHALPKRKRCERPRMNFTFRRITPYYHQR